MPPNALMDMAVSDLMARWPKTVSVFLRRRMSCPGCLMAPFMTVAEAAREYSFVADELAHELSSVIEASSEMRRG